MFEDDIDVVALAVKFQIALPNSRAFFSHSAYSGEPTLGIWPSS